MINKKFRAVVVVLVVVLAVVVGGWVWLAKEKQEAQSKKTYKIGVLISIPFFQTYRILLKRQ
ncbi:hypothetical protein A2397_02660 [Candidatus Amesbacteria bacterium RIFOXYB1_FULL_44_23]|uniref:Uncharacterized protein n=1 Tax=Candidatus Amesbacteria bacterium RIFOXYB1_FULL_44_23 TaxID=1797263 RepID=A0A1F4ZV84_9BACT|nr:MAG: hypothetical protein A2397_02660 [Candidatus Amesbacteria bacterium RIFOXYB1_FULL_44_23]